MTDARTTARSIFLTISALAIVSLLTPVRAERVSPSTVPLPRDGDGAECFTVLVGRAASADGSVMVAHNEDDRGDIVVNVRKVAPRADGAARAAGLLWIEATTQEFADSFVNEHGVLVTSDSCPSRVTAEDYTDGGIGGALRRLVAEQATSAREAVRIAGALVEKFGYRGSGRTYSIADRKEAWLMAVLRGRHWYAQRVPDDEVAVIPNHFTVRAIRPDDPGNFMGSPDIAEYAKANGWYDEAADGPFDFKKAFERPSTREPAADGNALRHWRGLELVTGKAWDLVRAYPFSVKPAGKMTAEALMAILRDHYEGTPYDATDGYTTGSPNRTKFRTICTASTINAFVVSLGGPRPEPLATAVWLAFGKPDTTVFLPLYYGVATMPAEALTLNAKVLALEKAAEENYGTMIGRLRKEMDPFEKGLLAARPKFEREFAALYRKDKAKAVARLDAYVAGALAEAAALTDRLSRGL
ncbi:MAG: C69 family dipeptidase [Candidatus Aminicenantes bacterium]|nr:C69 family dipeptidase [Candidatus Aminicenantes bacterium]